MGELVIHKIKSAWKYVVTFFKWTLIASIMGVIGGTIGSLFSICVKYANEYNNNFWFLTLFMPIGGILIVTAYKLCKIEHDPGTNCVIESIRTEKSVPRVLAPLIFFSTVITHLVGGSAGREGAALQLGGSLGTMVGRVFRLDKDDTHLVILCGMSSLFSSLFCTPITAAFFALEVISVGVTYYSALVPCFTSAIVAYFLSLQFGITPFRFNIDKVVPSLDIISIAQVVGLAAACALISIAFCVIMRKTQKYAKKFLKNEYLRVVVGGLLIIGLTFAIGTKDYNGAGTKVIFESLGGNARPEAFLLKILFTAITISFGYKGGEIVPTIFIGASFGCVFGSLLGLNPSFGAAMGIICLFCGVINCPVASIIMSVEVFGASGFMLFAIGCAVSYMLSGYYGLYSSQKIMYSKLTAKFINIHAK